MSIPKILHFTWKTEDVPGRMGQYLAAWRRLHPDWDVRLWTDATMRDFVVADYPEFLSLYDAYEKPIQRADSFRYLVLNRLGGVYADLDIEPFRSINGLVEGLTCFAGIEPDEHMGADRRHSGVPFLVSNAFMGSVPGHAYFERIVDLLPLVAGTRDVFLSTGPSLTTGTAVRMGRADRPVLVPPCLWSPLRDGGKPCRSDETLLALAGPGFDFVWRDRKPYVLHYWLTSWVPWHKRYKWLAKPFHAMHNLKWALRAARFSALEKIDIADPAHPYLDQAPRVVAEWPEIAICIVLADGADLSTALAAALSGLDYPKDRLSVWVGSFANGAAQAEVKTRLVALAASGFAKVEAIFMPEPERTPGLTPAHAAMARHAALRNSLADASANMAHVAFVGGHVTGIPAAAFKDMLGAGMPITALRTVDSAGNETDPGVFRYHWGGGIRVVYKIRDTDGLADFSRGQRDFLDGLKAFRLVPLDGVGDGLVLVDRAVFDSGVRFAEAPYHLHLDGEGFALMARHQGFEAAGLTEICVVAGI